VKISEDKIFIDPQIQSLIIQNDWASAANYLFNMQLKRWQLMKTNYDALKSVHIKSFWFQGFKFVVQFNPERMKSTAAVVDENSIASRPCFLCMKNIPEDQKGIVLRNNFVLLANPYPIFPQHFTIASLTHQPQRISEYFSEFLELSKLLSPNYSLVYNGPACGASAPDHLHFQAGTKQFIPIENDIQQMKNDYSRIFKKDEFATITFINDGLRRLIFIESIEKPPIEKYFSKIFSVYGKLSPNEQEPMINLICKYDKEFGWSLIIFLRSKHRPEYFYKEEPNKILISPAAIDLGGVIVTPREEDFNSVNKELVQQIINEVSYDLNSFALLEETFNSELN